MVKVTLENVVLAEFDSPVIVEGNYYFPPESVRKDNLVSSTTETTCSWKGTASYYSAGVAGKTVKDVAWYYAMPKEKAAHIKNHVAFYKNKVIIDD